MDDNTDWFGVGLDADNQTLDDAEEIIARSIATSIEQIANTAVGDPDALAPLKQATNMLCDHFRVRAQERIHKHVIEIARTLPLVPSEAIMFSLTDLATEQGIVEAGERICGYLRDDLHWLVWQALIPVNWTTVDSADYEGGIETSRAKSRPGPAPMTDDEMYQLYRDYMKSGLTQEIYASRKHQSLRQIKRATKLFGKPG